MSLQLPTLDDRTYDELLAEARRLIPIYDPTWTDHNPSDPGVVLIELFAYLTEMLLYRTDRLTADSQRRFVKLLEGADWQPSADLTADIRAAVSRARARDRAVSSADFERLSCIDFNDWLNEMRQLELRAILAGVSAEVLCDLVAESNPLKAWWQISQLPSEPANFPSKIASIARARCLPSRNLDRGSGWEDKDAPGHVSLIVLPESPLHDQTSTNLAQPTAQQKKVLWSFLEPRRTVTTRVHVVGPRYAPCSAEIVIAADSGALPAAIGERVILHIRSLFDATAREAGWAFGRNVYVSELYDQLERVAGVDYITDLMLTSECGPGETECSAARPLWHDSGQLIGLELMDHQLPMLRPGLRVILPTTTTPPPAANTDSLIVIAPQERILTLEVLCVLTLAAIADLMKLCSVRISVRSFLHPLHGALAAFVGETSQLALAELRRSLMNIEGVSEVRFAVPVAPARLDSNLQLQLNAGDVVDWHITFERIESQH